MPPPLGYHEYYYYEHRGTISVQVLGFSSFVHTPRSRIAGSDGDSFLQVFPNSHTVSSVASPCYIPTHRAEGSSFFISSPTLDIFCGFGFFLLFACLFAAVLVISVGVTCYRTVAWIYVSLMTQRLSTFPRAYWAFGRFL